MAKSYFMTIVRNCQYQTYNFQHRSTKINHYTCCSSGQLVLLNDWEDPHFFTSAFPSLFLFGTRSHLEQQKKLMFSETWAKWTLQYHSHW